MGIAINGKIWAVQDLIEKFREGAQLPMAVWEYISQALHVKD